MRNGKRRRSAGFCGIGMKKTIKQKETSKYVTNAQKQNLNIIFLQIYR